LKVKRKIIHVTAKMKTALSAALLISQAGAFVAPAARVTSVVSPSTSSLQSSNSDMFGGSSSSTETKSSFSSIGKNRDFKEEAAKLRQEAAEMEVALREEAREKGVPEEVINKLIPIRKETPKAAAGQQKAEQGSVAVMERPKLGAGDIRKKLGYLPAGDAVRMTAELDRLKGKKLLSIYNSVDFTRPSFTGNNVMLKNKVGVDFPELNLDDVGYDYRKVFFVALISGAVLGLSSSYVGGLLGFVLGYSSALIPVALVGIGSVAPALIGDVLRRIKLSSDEEAKASYVHMNAGRFIAGYATGLPVDRFNTGGPSTEVEFYQLRPTVGAPPPRREPGGNQYTQVDIARYSIVCLAGPVAECMAFGKGSGSNPADISVLYELLNSVPGMTAEKANQHIIWSALQAHEILKKNKKGMEAMVKAFEAETPFEECLAELEACAPESS
jgi:hypothetical protein